MYMALYITIMVIVVVIISRSHELGFYFCFILLHNVITLCILYVLVLFSMYYCHIIKYILIIIIVIIIYNSVFV